VRYGVMLDTSGSIDEVIKETRWAAQGGLSSVWSPQIFGYDALTLLAVVGREVDGIELGTAVVPTYPRHPIVLAGQALTTQAASGGRLALGIGLSHRIVIESMFGHSFDKPARHMREYLSVLLPLLQGQAVSFQGETLKATTMGPLDVKAKPPPVLLAALAPVMLRLAGSVADGTVTWMTGPSTRAPPRWWPRRTARTRSASARPTCSPRWPGGKRPRRRAEVVQHAVVAAGPAGQAHPASVEDHAQAEDAPLVGSEHGRQVLLHLHRVGVRREAQPPA